jgi:DNA-binding MarR family transcriptional regulator
MEPFPMSTQNHEVLDFAELRQESSDRADDLEIGPLDGMLSYHLRRAQTRLFSQFAQRLEDAQVTPSQLALLIKVYHNGGISQTALAKANGIERSTLGEIIDRFEKRQWVERRKHSSDRRAYALHVTEQGRRFLDSAIPAAMAVEMELTASWAEDDRQRLLALLKMLASA